jgi:hypothetical protein
MKLLVSFENPHTDWIPLIVFKNYYEYLITNNLDIEFEYLNPDPKLRTNPSGIYSPHIMRIVNKENGKYIIVSYWDRAIELTWAGNGWDSKNNVEILTSSGVHIPMKFTPFSYVCYSKKFEELSFIKELDFEKKTDTELRFRGYLYADRLNMSQYKPKYFPKDRKSIEEYFEEINNSQICLSLNGAGEICNRDMEILSCGSVLLRPILKQKFNNDLVPNVHYVGVDFTHDPRKQFDLLLKKYKEIKDNYEFLSKISKNGLDWFRKNATTNANVEQLKKLIDLEKLN